MDVDEIVIDEYGVKCVGHSLIYEYTMLIEIIYFDIMMECVNVVLYGKNKREMLR